MPAPQQIEIRSSNRIWSAPAERSGDGALAVTLGECQVVSVLMRLTYLLVSSLVLIVSFSPARGQLVTQNPPVPGGGTVSIWGHVTAMGKPVEGAMVGLWRQPHTQPDVNIMTTRTDGDGKYQLKALPANYFIAAKADGFVDVVENEPLLKSLRRVAVTQASWPLTVDFELVPAAALEGTVTDDQGKPVQQTPIRLMPVGMPTVSLPFWSFPRTDLLGRYRITGLPAGRYQIVAGDVAPVWDTSFGRLPHRRTFYPDAADQSQAKIIDISPGAELVHIDINMGPALKTFTVRVRLVADRDGQIPDSPDVSLEARYAGQGQMAVRPRDISRANGEIVIPNVPVGEYAISVWLGLYPLHPTGCLQITNPKLLGRSDHFEVIDKDVSVDLHISIPKTP